MFQLIPYERVQSMFADQYDIPLSAGSLVNFNREASERLKPFEGLAREKSRNLLERLRDYEDDVLRFMENAEVPFTNNQRERDLRMTKIKLKISVVSVRKMAPESSVLFATI